MNSIYLDPTNDVALKKIFANESKKEILISFLNSILELKDQKQIKEIEILNPYQVPKIKDLKQTILDVRCKDNRDISYIVEMQVSKSIGFEKRVLYYTSKAYVGQIEMGEDYPVLNQVIFLGILDFTIFENNHYLSNHLILNPKTGEHIFKDFRFSFVELPKFNKSLEELQSIEDKWIYFLKNAHGLQAEPQIINEKEITDAFEILKRYNWTKEELEVYDTISIYKQDEKGRVEQAKIEGKLEGKIETAKRMKEKGFEFPFISAMTGLTIEEIEKV